MCYVLVMLESSWIPEPVPSITLLTYFDRSSFHPHGILPAFEIRLAGKAMSIEVEMIDAPLDYNFLLGII